MVTIDVTNAFNSIPWKWVEKGLEEHGTNKELKDMIKGYFSDRDMWSIGTGMESRSKEDWKWEYRRARFLAQHYGYSV